MKERFRKKHFWWLASLPLVFLLMKSMLFVQKAPVEDAYLWLEEIHSDSTLSWVNAQKAPTALL